MSANDLTMSALQSTLGNHSWMQANAGSIVKSVPLEWTSCVNLILPFGFQLKLHGCDWRREADVIVALYWFNHLKLIESRMDPHGNGSPQSLIVRRCIASSNPNH